jgi:hypothetical protein
VTRVLIYSQIFPFPPQHGAHHRIIQLIRYFLSRNCDVHLICHSCTWGNQFDNGAINLNITADHIRFPSWGHKIDTAWKRYVQRRPVFGDGSIVSKLAFNTSLRRLAPDIVLMNYANSLSLLPDATSATVVVDTHDFLSLSWHLSTRARALIDAERYEFSPLALTVETYLRDAAKEVSLEFAALGRPNLILAISEHEGQIFREQTDRAVHVLSYRAEAPQVRAPSQLSQLGVMPIGTGDNPHNILGAYCIDHAMRCFDSTRTVVAAVGHAAREIRLGSWCEPLGHVSDYFGTVRNYEFGVCPAFWGTGAQIKQYEFGELGMPIVAYRWMVDSELWVDEENCLLVDDPRAFAERLCLIASSRPMTEMRERAKLLKERAAKRLERQCAELDRRLGLRAAASANA